MIEGRSMRGGPIGRSRGYYAGRLILHVIVFVALGPLIGAAIFAGSHLEALPAVILFAYPIGAGPAALTGFATAVASAFLVKPGHLEAFAAAVAALSCIIEVLVAFRVEAQTWGDVWVAGLLAGTFLGLIGVVAALICALLLRPLRLGRDEVVRANS